MKPRTVVFTLFALALLAIATPSASAQLTLDLLHTFTGGTDGNHPAAGVIQDAEGSLYGTTEFGGTGCAPAGCGTVFKMDKNGQYTVLYRFQGGSDGANPVAGLARDSSGNLYGTTQGNAFTDSVSTLFKLDTSGHETVLFTFGNSFADGGVANTTPLLDAAGNLYGTTPVGGDVNCQIEGTGNGCGVIYKLDASGKFSVIHTFKTFAAGGEPQGGLVMDASGNLYGSTVGGGVGKNNRVCSYLGITKIGCGTVFRLDAVGKFKVLYRFQGKADGANPVGVIGDGAGNLYGVTDNGGDFNCSTVFTSGCGTIFKIDAAGKFSVLHTFHPNPVSNPMYNNLVRDSKGNLYSTNFFGGIHGAGYLFELDAAGKFSVLYNFPGEPSTDGNFPTGTIIAPNGDFYGTLGMGGEQGCGFLGDGCGTVFKLTH